MARLRPDQEELLLKLCEAEAAGPRDDFLALRTMSDDFIRHPAWAQELTDFVWSDLEVLIRYGMLHVTNRGEHGDTTFVVSPDGWEYHEELQESKGGAVERVEDEVRRLLGPRPTSGPYVAAFDRWADAESLLWPPDQADVTTIGHRCREAMQLYADAFLRSHEETSNEDVARTINRVRDGIAAMSDGLSDRHAALLNVLLDYWKAVYGLVQRLEHGNAKQDDRSTGRTPASSSLRPAWLCSS